MTPLETALRAEQAVDRFTTLPLREPYADGIRDASRILAEIRVCATMALAGHTDTEVAARLLSLVRSVQ